MASVQSLSNYPQPTGLAAGQYMLVICGLDREYHEVLESGRGSTFEVASIHAIAQSVGRVMISIVILDNLGAPVARYLDGEQTSI